jgi:regulator of protease activity HflC (stomatin/prohibitin superfamily)
MDQFPLVLIAVIIVLIWLFNSLNVLREYERGVIFRIGRLLAEPKGPGLIWVFWHLFTSSPTFPKSSWPHC